MKDPKDMTTEEAFEFVKSELQKSIDNVIGEPVSPTTKVKIKSNITSAMSRMVDTFGIHEKMPNPVVSVNGNEVNIQFEHPDTGKLMTKNDWVKFMGGY